MADDQAVECLSECFIKCYEDMINSKVKFEIYGDGSIVTAHLLSVATQDDQNAAYDAARHLADSVMKELGRH